MGSDDTKCLCNQPQVILTNIPNSFRNSLRSSLAAFMSITIMITLSSLLRGTSTTIIQVISWNALLGASISGFVVPFDLVAEFSPNKGRASR